MTASAANQMTTTGVPQPLHLFLCMARLAGLQAYITRVTVDNYKAEIPSAPRIVGPRGYIEHARDGILRWTVPNADQRSGLGLSWSDLTPKVVTQEFAWDNLAAGAAALVNIGLAELPDRVVKDCVANNTPRLWVPNDY